MRTTRLLVMTLALLPLAAAAASTDEARGVRREIVALTVDHALNLSQVQARALLPVLQAAASDARTWRAAVKPELLAALVQERDELRATGTVSDSTRQALAAARQDARSGMREQGQALRQQVMQVLTPEQVQALAQLHARHGAAPGGGEPRTAHGPGRHQLLMRTLTSEPFLALLQARAA